MEKSEEPLSPLLPAGAIRYRLTNGDLFRWEVYHHTTNRVTIGLMLVAPVVLVATFWPFDTVALLAFAILTPLFYASIIATVAAVMTLDARRRDPLLVGEHVLELTDEGVVDRADTTKPVFRLAQLEKIVSTKRYFYVFIKDIGVGIVPKRAFATEDEARAFQTAIQQRRSKA